MTPLFNVVSTQILVSILRCVVFAYSTGQGLPFEEASGSQQGAPV